MRMNFSRNPKARWYYFDPQISSQDINVSSQNESFAMGKLPLHIAS